MMEQIEQGLMSAGVFLEIAARPENAGIRMELIDGEVYMTAAYLNHGEMAAILLIKLGAYVYEKRLGRLVTAETGFRLDDGTVIAPDGGFYSNERAPQRLPASYEYATAPDLIFEVLSKSNTQHEVMLKLEKYMSHGCRMAWIVNPSVRHVWVYTPNGDGSMISRDYGIDDTLTGGDVLPGFELPVRVIFEDATA